jgi:hypothetical protein
MAEVEQRAGVTFKSAWSSHAGWTDAKNSKVVIDTKPAQEEIKAPLVIEEEAVSAPPAITSLRPIVAASA